MTSSIQGMKAFLRSALAATRREPLCPICKTPSPGGDVHRDMCYDEHLQRTVL